MLRGGVEALEFVVQFVNACPPLFIFSTLHVRRPAEGFLFNRVDLLLNKLAEFVSDTYRIVTHWCTLQGRMGCVDGDDGREVGRRKLTVEQLDPLVNRKDGWTTRCATNGGAISYLAYNYGLENSVALVLPNACVMPEGSLRGSQAKRPR
jgi:hypothetical protein